MDIMDYGGYDGSIIVLYLPSLSSPFSTFTNICTNITFNIIYIIVINININIIFIGNSKSIIRCLWGEKVDINCQTNR